MQKPRATLSAGILVYRRRERRLEVLLIHPGGPFWRNKDAGSWQIPKGLVGPNEQSVAAALREFKEETGVNLDGEPIPLGRIRQAGGKWVEGFALAAEVDSAAIVSNSFELEWPPGSGKVENFPEIDRAQWLSIKQARTKMLHSQTPFLDALEAILADTERSGCRGS
jgi:predicted NUDIX family NTP pyrophosphohydrolase